MNISDEQVRAGQAVYTKRSLRLYDLVVLGLTNRLVWKCPTPGLLAHYNRHVSANHLDVGVGTGYFLERCRFPSDAPRIALLDINRSSLAFAAARIAQRTPEKYLRNVLEPLSIDAANFDSVGLNYLLHCLPGAIGSKSVVLDHLKAHMNPGAVLFGSTLLQGGVSRGWAARRLMAFYNGKGIFCNRDDHLQGLEQALAQRFPDHSIQVAGCAALFSARL
ncbi:MAG: class I SAM-dependent methyltransferase [Caldilineaceae bacterium]|uniref:Class I SAM-dependent methyltransferase n=1 Tax=Caldilineaceae bacterium SB0664_bin_27 TaxID=2605260 RepID=A0A6B0Z083_9CHLR|nr:class I SAM-dependent methyltransferase [Caldilineaceae bacterium]MDE0339068.1 class I SAM-dependent methyltransferase [Caldilineaceae bacterium]MXY95302.1 class I SAM-dependent methyltransferase [Caldilineaceae bacterium SB0664_bin_27]